MQNKKLIYIYIYIIMKLKYLMKILFSFNSLTYNERLFTQVRLSLLRIIKRVEILLGEKLSRSLDPSWCELIRSTQWLSI